MKLLTLLFVIASLTCTAEESSLVAPATQGSLIVHNRILAKINGKTISVLDVMKKMEVFFARNYPQYASSPTARYQFFSSQWRNSLAEMIDRELIVADAEAKGIKIKDGDLREAIQERFGPNLMQTFDKLGITYEEAKAMTETDMIVERMNWFRVTAKVFQNVHPQNIKEAYKEYQLTHPPKEEWTYQVLSLRGEDREKIAAFAQRAEAVLRRGSTSFAAVEDELKQEEENPAVAVTVSQEQHADDKTISAAHKEVLATLKPGSYSQPIAQVSRFDNSTVYRIFYLKEHVHVETPPFEKMSEKLYQGLLDEKLTKENAEYLNKLRKRFNYDEKYLSEMIPADFEPFALH